MPTIKDTWKLRLCSNDKERERESVDFREGISRALRTPLTSPLNTASPPFSAHNQGSKVPTQQHQDSNSASLHTTRRSAILGLFTTLYYYTVCLEWSKAFLLQVSEGRGGEGRGGPSACRQISICVHSYTLQQQHKHSLKEPELEALHHQSANTI